MIEYVTSIIVPYVQCTQSKFSTDTAAVVIMDDFNRLMTEFIWIILITWWSCSYAQDFDLELETGVLPVLF